MVSYLRALLVWIGTYVIQLWVAQISHWQLNETDFYIFYGVAVIMMVISYITGRIDETRDKLK